MPGGNHRARGFRTDGQRGRTRQCRRWPTRCRAQRRDSVRLQVPCFPPAMPFSFIVRFRGGSFSRRVAATALAAMALTGAALAQEPPAAAPAPAAADAGPSFAIEIRAPATVKPLLERHLELRRYREVTDLDDAELARLIVMAERDVRELVGTLGFFNPRISIRRETARGDTAGDRGRGRTRRPHAGVRGRHRLRGRNRRQPRTRMRPRSAKKSAAAGAFPPDSASRRRAGTAPRPRRCGSWCARRYPAGRVSYSLADIDAPAGRARLGLRLDSGPLFRLGAHAGERRRALRPACWCRAWPGCPRAASTTASRIQQAQLRLAGSGYLRLGLHLRRPASRPEGGAGAGERARSAAAQSRAGRGPDDRQRSARLGGIPQQPRAGHRLARA